MGFLSRKPKVQTPDGHTIVLSVERAKKKTQSVAILTHGIFTDQDEKGRFVRLSSRLTSAGIDVVRFDFRGHGHSPLPSAEFCVSGGVIDFHTVLDWVAETGWTNVAVVGSSFGGGLVVLERSLPVLRPVDCYVLLNPVIDYRATFLKPLLGWGKEIFSDQTIEQIFRNGKATVINDFQASLLFLTELAAIEPYFVLRRIEVPMMVFHGDADEKVPFQPATQHFSKFENVTLKIVPGAGHAFKDPQIENQIHHETVSWISELINKK